MAGPVAAAGAAGTASFPWLSFALPALGMLGDAMTRPKFSGINPEQYKNELLLSDSDINAELGQIRSDLQGAAMGQVGAIKQAGAANRLPKGAVLSAIAGTGENVGKAYAKAKPYYNDLKRKSLIDYLNMQNQYQMNKMNFDQSLSDRTWGGLGSLGQVAMLWQGGFLNGGK